MLLAPKRWQQVKRLFENASKKPESDWPTFLDEHCPNDDEIRSAVEQMLHAHSSAGRFLENPALGEDFHLDQSQRLPNVQHLEPSRQIGKYTIVRRISGGGMGDVYEATQANPTRKVALKVLKTGLRSHQAQRRFEYESELLAQLQHPGIAQVHESARQDIDGETDPYFALEFIENAQSITRYATSENLTLARKLSLFAMVCDAVHHAHQNGIIHRDIKPANILVDSAGHPKLIDFGIAQTADIALDATADHLVGTLQYMSPEQCSPGSARIDLRTDVYSLGIVLYELLTDALPYQVDVGSLVKSARIVEQQQPKNPSSINPSITRDTQSVVLHALQKNPADRYQSVADLARDARAIVSRHPVSARNPTITYQLRMWTRRHRGIAALCGVLVLLVVGAAGALTSQSINIARERDRANRISSYLESILIHGNPKSAGHDITMREVIDEAAATVHEDLADTPEVEARIRWLLGANVYWPMNRLDRAEEHMFAAIQINDELLGPDHPDVTCEKTSLADLLLVKQNIPAALELLSQVRDAIAPDDPSIIGVYDGFGTAAKLRNKFESAESYCEQSIAARQRFHGRWSIQYAEGVEKYADLLCHAGRIDEAIDLQREGVRTRTAVVGEHDVGTAEQMGYLAHMLTTRRQGRDLIEAEQLCRRCMTIFESLAGRKDLDYAWITSYLAGTLTRQNRWDEALETYQYALALKRDIVGDGHIEVANTLNAMAYLREQTGDHQDAVTLYMESHQISENVFGLHHHEAQCSADRLENALRKAGRDTEADQFAADFVARQSAELSLTTTPKQD